MTKRSRRRSRFPNRLRRRAGGWTGHNMRMRKVLISVIAAVVAVGVVEGAEDVGADEGAVAGEDEDVAAVEFLEFGDADAGGVAGAEAFGLLDPEAGLELLPVGLHRDREAGHLLLRHHHQ